VEFAFDPESASFKVGQILGCPWEKTGARNLMLEQVGISPRDAPTNKSLSRKTRSKTTFSKEILRSCSVEPRA